MRSSYSDPTRRVVALLLAPGFAALAFDTFVAHAAGSHAAQPIPIVAGVALALAMVVGASLPSRTLFLRVLAVVGVIAVIVGALGTYFHALPVVAYLDGEPLGWTSLMAALEVSPPALAPAGFVGLGGLAAALSSARVTIGVSRSSVHLQPRRPLAGPQESFE